MSTRTTYTKRVREEPHVQRPKHRRTVMLVRRWIVFQRDETGEEPSADRVWEHICRNWRHMPKADRVSVYEELGYV